MYSGMNLREENAIRVFIYLEGFSGNELISKRFTRNFFETLLLVRLGVIGYGVWLCFSIRL